MQCLLRIISLSALSMVLAVPAAAIDNLTICHWQLLDEELHMYRYDKENLDWRQIREERALSRTVRNGPKHLELRFATISDPFSSLASGSDFAPLAKKMLIRDPDGGIKHVVPADQPRQYTVAIPEDLPSITASGGYGGTLKRWSKAHILLRTWSLNRTEFLILDRTNLNRLNEYVLFL